MMPLKKISSGASMIVCGALFSASYAAQPLTEKKDLPKKEEAAKSSPLSLVKKAKESFEIPAAKDQKETDDKKEAAKSSSNPKVIPKASVEEKKEGNLISANDVGPLQPPIPAWAFNNEAIDNVPLVHLARVVPPVSDSDEGDEVKDEEPPTQDDIFGHTVQGHPYFTLEHTFYEEESSLSPFHDNECLYGSDMDVESSD